MDAYYQMALKIEQELRLPFARRFGTQAGELGAQRLVDASEATSPTPSQVGKTSSSKTIATDKGKRVIENTLHHNTKDLECSRRGGKGHYVVGCPTRNLH